jgi:hypothetical protein
MYGLAAVLSASVAVFAASAAAAPAPGGAGAALSPRYASPTGQGSATCPKAEPCDIVTAINSAPAQSHVILLPGTYDDSATVTDTNPGLLISGEAGKSRPVIVSSVGSFGAVYLNNGSRVTGLRIDYTGPTQGLVVLNGSADHMVVISSGDASRSCNVDTTLSDSLCTNSTSNGSALATVVEGSASPVYRNVTAIATGNLSQGLAVEGDGGTTAVTATNSIFKGVGDDVAFIPEGDDEHESIMLHRCDFATSYFVNSPGVTTESITVDNTDVKAAPKFAGASSGDFRERAGSPTINRASSVPASDTDLAGQPRTLGKAPDMGAYEFLQKASVSSPKLSKKKSTSVKVAVAVNPEGLASKVRVVATHGRLTISTRTLSAGKSRSAKKLTFGLSKLRAHTKYSIHVVAVSAAGTTKSSTKKFTTPKH